MMPLAAFPKSCLSSLEAIFLFQEHYVTIAATNFIQTHGGIYVLGDLERVNILSNDKQLARWHNFLTAIPRGKRSCLKNLIQTNHVRNIINGIAPGVFSPDRIAFNFLRYAVGRRIIKGIATNENI